MRRGAAAGARGAGRRHASTCSRRPPSTRSDKVVAASSRVGLRPGRGVPDHGAAPPPQQRHVLRRGQVVQRGHAAQLPRDVRPGLRRAALLQRVRPADGRPRRLHRGADPLDGAHRRRQAAADLRRRPADDGLRLHRRHRPGQPARRRVSDVDEGVYNVASGTETSLLELAEALLRGDGLRSRRRARPGARGQRRHPAARRHRGGRATTSASRPRSVSTTGLRELVDVVARRASARSPARPVLLGALA